MQVNLLELRTNTGRTELFQPQLTVESSAIKAVDTPDSEGRVRCSLHTLQTGIKYLYRTCEPAAVKFPARAGK
jgi:hypothetical protein